MASPCACGGVALLLSGLKATNQTITPNRQTTYQRGSPFITQCDGLRRPLRSPDAASGFCDSYVCCNWAPHDLVCTLLNPSCQLSWLHNGRLQPTKHVPLHFVDGCRVRRALENTAKPVGSSPDALLTYGCGLLQVGLPAYILSTVTVLCQLYLTPFQASYAQCLQGSNSV